MDSKTYWLGVILPFTSSVCWSVCHYFLKQRKVSLLCFYRSLVINEFLFQDCPKVESWRPVGQENSAQKSKGSCLLKRRHLAGRVADPDPVGSGVFAWIWISFKFLWIRIRFSNSSGSESGFQISLDPDPDLVSAQILEQKKLQKGL